jgi:hypothetical protein
LYLWASPAETIIPQKVHFPGHFFIETVLLVNIKTNEMSVKLYCPENLDLQAIMDARPGWQGIKKDHLLFILHSIIQEKAHNDPERWEKLGKKDGFVPLHSKVLEEKIPPYRRHLDYLIDAGIIESDEEYMPGVVSIGYRFTAAFRGVNYKRVEIQDFILRRKIKEGSIFSKTNAIGLRYPNLLKWFKSRKLQIDRRAAIRWVNEQEEQVMKILKGKKLSKVRLIEERVAVIEKYANQRLQVTRIAEHDYYYSIDGTGNRLHTNLTNLPKGLRNFLTYDGRQLVSIDIRNSQPYMSLALFDKKFWQPNVKMEYPTLKKMDKGLYDRMGKEDMHFQYSIMFVDSSKTLVRSDLQKDIFSRNVIQGTIYEYLQEVFEREGQLNLGSTHDEKRSRVKKIVLTLLFDADWKVYNREPRSPVQIFRRHFPTIARAFAYIKEYDYRTLAIILQRIESYLLLDKICRCISQERPDIPLFTIHDNIITTVGNEEYVQSVMREELARIMGAAPQLAVEYWSQPVSVIGLLIEKATFFIGIKYSGRNFISYRG